MNNKEIDKARVFIYNVLSLLFVEEHVKNNKEQLVQNLEVFSLNSFDNEVAKITQTLALLIASYKKDELYVQYQELFLVPFGDYVSLSASWHHEQREAGLMLIKVREVLAKTKIRRDEKSFTAQEDNFGFIFTLCAYLIESQVNLQIKQNLQKELFKEVINPLIDKFIFQLISSKSEVYCKVGSILGSFIGFERSYLEISKK